MKFLRRSKVEIWSDNVATLSPEEMNEMVKRAGMVSHRSHSRKSPEKFVRMLKRLGHFSVLEHSWVSFLIRTERREERDRLELELLKANNLFSISNRGEKSFILSGNARIFEESYRRRPDIIINQELISFLHKINPVLFPEMLELKEKLPIDIILNPSLYPMEEWFHRAMSVLFLDISRGFTHEMVRSRLFAFTQESTRYVNYEKKGLAFVIPYPKMNSLKKFVLELTSVTIGLVYKLLIKSGMKPEEARQILPIGVRTEIVATANMKAWLHWFKIRTDKHAHWEIRWAACQLLKEVEQRMPEMNLDLIFEFHTDKNGIPYTNCIKDKNHIL